MCDASTVDSNDVDTHVFFLNAKCTPESQAITPVTALFSSSCVLDES